jgi:protein TIF31
MKQPNENPSSTPTTTTDSDFMTCNGHPDDLIKTRKDSDNDDSTNTSSTSSINDVSVNNCPNTSSNSNTSEIQTTNPNNSNELVVLPEVSFNIRVQSPGLDIFDLPVTSSELVQEIHQVLMDKEETCHRTCFSLQLDGIILDNFTELKNIEGLKEGSLLKVVEGLFSLSIHYFYFKSI